MTCIILIALKKILFKNKLLRINFILDIFDLIEMINLKTK